MAEISLSANPQFCRTLAVLSSSHQQQLGKVVVNAAVNAVVSDLAIAANLWRGPRIM
jgi:hypothetical protein